MRVFFVCCHSESQSFNVAMFQTACETFAAAGMVETGEKISSFSGDPQKEDLHWNSLLNSIKGPGNETENTVYLPGVS